MHKLANSQLPVWRSTHPPADPSRTLIKRQPKAIQPTPDGHTPVDTNESRAQQPSLSGPALGSSQTQYQPTALECAQAEQGVP